MSCKVGFVQEVAQVHVDLLEQDSLSPEEWLIIRFYRDLSEPDQMMMQRMLSALVARTKSC